MVYKKKKNLHTWSWIALILMYVTVVLGVFIPISLPNPIVTWLWILMIYAFIASTLPVETLLQPRDYINSHELLVAMGLITLGGIAAAIGDPGHLNYVAPAFNAHPKGAPPIWPFLFVTIACGAISGFHSLVASGTSSKQIDKESDAHLVGYGGMVAEGILASLVILAVAAGLGAFGKGLDEGIKAWQTHYADWATAKGLGAKIGAFVEGSANMMQYIFGRSQFVHDVLTTIMGVFIVSFAGTTLDTATRVQRYIIQEIGESTKQGWMKNKYVATFLAVATALALAFANPSGKGALILWPLFGTVNQLLAALALLVITVYLVRKRSNPWIAAIPMIFMVLMTSWAMVMNIKNFAKTHNSLLFTIGTIVFILMLWLVVEAIIVISKAKKFEEGEMS